MQAPTRYNVLAPGPVNLHPEVEKALSLPMIHHRTPEFDAVLKRVLTRLKVVFETEQPCFLLSSTGSGGMEALLVNVLTPGDRVLGIDSGKFGERWCEMAKIFGAELVTMKVPWGEAVDAREVKKILDQDPKIKIVLCQACETSSAVKHPIREIAALIKDRPQTLFLVDAITALGAFPLKMDEWGLDGVVGGSQKAFMLPTGLSMISFSKKAWKVIETNPQPRFYFDIRREKTANAKGETFFSSSVTLIRALDVVLEMILNKGLAAHFAEIAERARFVREFAPRLGFGFYSKSPSESLTALTVPAGMDSQKLRTRLEEKHHITVMGGQDQAKGKILRIGHMGYIQPAQMVDLMLKLADVLREENPAHPLPDLRRLESDMKGFWNA
jgi:aspartate aminotransferase-like enzyme